MTIEPLNDRLIRSAGPNPTKSLSREAIADISTHERTLSSRSAPDGKEGEGLRN